jgi:hypothetical protein
VDCHRALGPPEGSGDLGVDCPSAIRRSTSTSRGVSPVRGV